MMDKQVTEDDVFQTCEVHGFPLDPSQLEVVTAVVNQMLLGASVPSQPTAPADEDALKLMFRAACDRVVAGENMMTDKAIVSFIATLGEAPSTAAQGATLTDEQWYDLAQRHANADWNSNGYLDAVKALCADFALLAAAKPVSDWPMLRPLHLQAIMFAYNEGYSKAYDGRVFANPFAEAGSQAASWELGTKDGADNRERDAKPVSVDAGVLTDSDVFTLIGHAEFLRGKGEEDMPKWCMDLARRIALCLGDQHLADRVRSLTPPTESTGEPQ